MQDRGRETLEGGRVALAGAAADLDRAADRAAPGMHLGGERLAEQARSCGPLIAANSSKTPETPPNDSRGDSASAPDDEAEARAGAERDGSYGLIGLIAATLSGALVGLLMAGQVTPSLALFLGAAVGCGLGWSARGLLR